MTTKGCTVKELREFLTKLPDDMSVFVYVEKNRNWETWTERAPLVLPVGDASSTDTLEAFGGTLDLGSR